MQLAWSLVRGAVIMSRMGNDRGEVRTGGDGAARGATEGNAGSFNRGARSPRRRRLWKATSSAPSPTPSATSSSTNGDARQLESRLIANGGKRGKAGGCACRGRSRLPAPMSTLKGKTLFITGASRGIGKAIGLRAARDGANVVIAAKTDQPHPKLAGTIHTAAEEIEKAGGRALACVVDVRSEDQIKAAVEAAVKKFGGIDILVNNASA